MKVLATIGFALMIIAGLLFVAGAPTINLMPRNIANFSGIAVAAVGVLVWVVYGVTRRQEQTDEKDESQPRLYRVPIIGSHGRISGRT